MNVKNLLRDSNLEVKSLAEIFYGILAKKLPSFPDGSRLGEG